jgi:hypothetical protein
LLPVEVELSSKSVKRLRAILGLHAAWIAAGKSSAVIYVCGPAQLAERVGREAAEFGLTGERKTLRVELEGVLIDLAADQKPLQDIDLTLPQPLGNRRFVDRAAVIAHASTLSLSRKAQAKRLASAARARHRPRGGDVHVFGLLATDLPDSQTVS